MSYLPDELWRRILEIGITGTCSNLVYKDLCSLSITCRRFKRLSADNSLWSSLLSSDFPSSTSSIPPDSSFKSLYKFRFERDKERKLLAHRRTVLRVESRIAEHSRKIQEIQRGLAVESEKFNSTLLELSNLRRVRQASTALNVWQPEVIRSRQKQIVEQSVVPADYRIHALEMELKLSKQQIAGFDKAHTDEKRRLDASKEQLASVKYHPLRDYNLTSSSVGERSVKRKKSKKYVDCEPLISFSS
ncbi:hypothetical protein LguiA_024884 [Lonicera macranthoides]